MDNYTNIYEWRIQQMKSTTMDYLQLNQLHDQTMEQVIDLAVKKLQNEQGSPPAPFAFFLMGSAGRFEQSVWSDQDHGIIFNGENSCLDYFLALGTEIMAGLEKTGYERCDGKVMSSNPLWCQSLDNWKSQIESWLQEESWQSLRHFSTFFDSRVLIGETKFLDELKQEAFGLLEKEPRLYTRLVENVDLIKKGIGVFGQLLSESKGTETGSLQLKQVAFFPYVNAARLLALKENILVPSTLNRIEQLPELYGPIKQYKKDFHHLLAFQLRLRRNAKSYEDVHLIPLNSLTKADKQELKRLIKSGNSFFSKTKAIVKEEGSTW